MSFDAHANFAYSAIATAPVPALSGTALNVTPGTGALFPAAPFNAIVWPTGAFPFATNTEIIRVTSKGTGDDWTVTRTGETGGTNRTIIVGDQISCSITAKLLTDIEAAIPAAQTALSGLIVSDATYTSGTVSFSNQANITIGSSVNGATQYIRLSGHPAQTVQTQSLIAALYDGANSISTGTARFTNANGVTFTINGQTISGSVATTYLGSNASTNYVQANAAFAGTNASGTIASSGISVAVAAPVPIGTAVKAVASVGSTGTITRYAPEDHQHAGVAAFAVTNTGNTAGNTRSQVGTFYLAASGAITASQSTAAAGNDTVWLSVAAQTNQSAIKGFGASNTGNTAGNTGLSTGIDWVLAGSNNVTISQSTTAGGPNTLWVSGPNVGAAQTGISGIVVSDTTYVSGTVSFSNQANITIGSSVNGATQYIRLSGNAAQTNQSAIKAFGVSNTGNTAGNTGVSTGIDWVLAGSGSITLSQSTAGGGPDTVWIQHPAWISSQSTQFMALTLGGNTAGTTTFHASNNASLFFNAGNNITLSGNGSTVTIIGASAAPSPVVISAGASSDSLASIVFSDSNGVSFGLNGSTITATVSTYSTVGTATTGKSVASANSVGTITRWAAEDHAHAGVGGIGISTQGNTSGTTGSVLGTYWLQGTNNITLSQITSNNGSHTLVVSGGPGPGTISMWPDVLPGSTAVSTYYSGSTSAGGGGASTQSGYTMSIYVVPMPLQAAVAFSELRLGVSNTRLTSGTGSVTHLYSVGIYTNNASTLSLVKGYYGGLYLSQNSVTAQSFSLFTLSTGSNSVAAAGGLAGLQAVSVYSSAGNISANSQMDGAPGVKFLRVDNGAATTLTEGQYYVALANITVSAGANVYSCVGVLQSNAISSVNIPDLGRENSTQSSNYLPAWGAISTTYTSQSSAATFFPLPSAIPLTNMSRSSSAWYRFHFPLMRNLS